MNKSSLPIEIQKFRRRKRFVMVLKKYTKFCKTAAVFLIASLCLFVVW